MHAKIFTSLSIVVLLLASCAIPSAAYDGWSFWKDKMDYEQEMNEIQNSLDLLEGDSEKMGFIYKNMDDAGIGTVKIVVVKDDKKILKTFYIVSGQGIFDEGSVDESIADKDSIVTFRPTIRQAKQGIKLLEDEKITVGEMIRATMLYRMVENENVPPVQETIKKLDRDMLNNMLPIPLKRIERMLG